MRHQLKFNELGSSDGSLVVYFHGALGAPEECSSFDLEGKRRGLRFICLDRFSIDPSIKGEAYFKLLADEISGMAAGKKVDFVAFSIGAFVALQTTRYLGDGVRNLHLVSAAAPLEAGDYLDAMAGKLAFKLASAFPVLFVLLSYWQAFLAWCFPKTLFDLLFASAVGKDKVLAGKPSFQSSMIKILRSCFLGRVRGYTRDVFAYVQPWASTLSEIAVKTHLWHGTDDNWSPPQMADNLKSAIRGGASITKIAGASHYSCLYAAAPEMCALLGET